MTTSKSNRGLAKPMAQGVITGTALALGITAVSAMFLTILVLNDQITWNAVGYCMMVVIGISAFTGSSIANHQVKRQKAAVHAITGALYGLTLILAGVSLFRGEIETAITIAALTASGTGVSFLVHSAEKYGKPKRKRKFKL